MEQQTAAGQHLAWVPAAGGACVCFVGSSFQAASFPPVRHPLLPCFPHLPCPASPSPLPADAALDYAVAQSYDHMYGARPLRRWLEHSIITPLSRMIISGELPDDSKVVVDAPASGAGGLTFAVQVGGAAAAQRGMRLMRG